MQIKEVTHLEVEVRGSAGLTMHEMVSLLNRSFPKGFEGVLKSEITATSTFGGNKGNYVIAIQPPESPQHVNGDFCDRPKFDAVIRDILTTCQQQVDKYQQFRAFTEIDNHRGHA